MSLTNDIATALLIERRWLHGMVTHGPDEAVGGVRVAPAFKSEQVDAMVRIEVDRDHEHELFRDPSSHLSFQIRSGPREGPLEFMGSALYIVDRLPDPGWRVINPMKAERKR